MRKLLTLCLVLLLLCGCGKETPTAVPAPAQTQTLPAKEPSQYSVDYHGSKELYRDAKDAYPAGETVVLYFDLIATDTDYSFFLDEEYLNVSYENDSFKLTFVMPEHDVSLRCETRNSMEYVPPVQLPEEADVMVLDYFEGTQGTEDRSYEELVLYTTDDPTVLLLRHYAVDAEGKETVTEYHVSYHAAEICYTIMENYDMRYWETMDDTVSLDGVLRSCKFYEDGDYFRVSTEQMPENGETGLDEIRLTLQDYMIQ